METTMAITPQDVIAFTEGDCWALAQRISSKTGWQAYALGAYQGVRTALTDFIWIHVVVQTPTGEFLDVQGVTSADTLMNRYADIMAEVHGWSPPRLDMLPISTAADWAVIIHGQPRIHPAADIATVAETLVDEYDNYAYMCSPDNPWRVA